MAEKGERETRSLARWDPFRELGFPEWGRVREFPRMSLLGRMMEELFEGRPRALQALGPPIDITETDGDYVVTAEVPGVKREDITLEVQEGVLSIRGEKKSEREEAKEKGRWLERSYGAFSRSFTLPADADAEHIRASFADGVLKITVAKKPEAKAKTIAIKG